MIRGVIFAVIAGVIGAGLWAAIAYLGNLELGILAWAIGAAVGAAMLAGAQAEAGVPTGIAALVVALAAIAGGKLIAVEMAIRSELGAIVEDHEQQLRTDDAFAITYVADDVLVEYEDAGREINYPETADLDAPSGASDYPPDVWATAETRWNAMTPDEKEQVRQTAIDNTQAAIAFVTDLARTEGFKSSFSLFDLLWFGLGGFSAFKLGAGLSSQ